MIGAISMIGTVRFAAADWGEMLRAVPWYVWLLLAIVIILGIAALRTLPGMLKRRTEYDARAEVISDGELTQEIGVQRQPYFMLVDKGADGKWIHAAFQTGGGQSSAIQAQIDGAIKDMRKVKDITGVQYIITDKGHMNPSRPGGLLPYTMYVLLRVPRARDAIKVLKSFIDRVLKGGRSYITPTPFPAFVHMFYNKDPFGRPHTLPVWVTFEQPGFTMHDWMSMVIKRPEIAGSLGVPDFGDQMQAYLGEQAGAGAQVKEGGLPIAFGGVDESAAEDMARRALVGYSYDTGQKIYVDLKSGRYAHGYAAGSSGQGKTYFAAVLAELAVLENNAAVIIIDPTQKHTSYLLENKDLSAMEPDERRVIEYFHRELGHDHVPMSVPTKVLLIGREGENLPYDEIFKINVSELSLPALCAIVSVAAELTDVQKIFLRIVTNILRDTKPKYDLDDIVNVISNIKNRPEMYEKYYKVLSSKDVGKGRYASTLTAISVRVDDIEGRLPDVFVAEGGTDFKEVIKKGTVTTFIFSSKVTSDTYLLSGVIEYITNKILFTYGPLAPDALKQKRSGVEYLVIYEEAPRFMAKIEMPSAQAAKELTDQGRKWGIHGFFIVQTISDLAKEISTNIRLCKVVFLPDERQYADNLKLFEQSQKDTVLAAFAKMKAEKWPGLAIVSGEGTNASPLVLCRTTPRRTSSRAIEDRTEWLDIRKRLAAEKRGEEEAAAGGTADLVEEMEELLKEK